MIVVLFFRQGLMGDNELTPDFIKSLFKRKKKANKLEEVQK